MYVKLKTAMEMLDVCGNTLRKWADAGKIKTIRNPSKQRMFDIDSFLKERNGLPKNSVCYCRVSSAKQKDDLKRQVEFMRERFPKNEIIQDLGSGLNFKRKGFVALLERVVKGEIEEVVVAHRDRLCRFGFELVEWFIKRNHGRIVVLDKAESSPETELVRDILSIIHVFSCRINGLRKYSSKIKEDKDIPQ